MKLHLSYHGGTRFDITSGSHRIVTDQPTANGGQDAGMSPVELFVGSVASAVAESIGRFCAGLQIPIEGLTVDAEWTVEGRPPRVAQLNLSIHLPHRMTANRRQQILKVAQRSTVHQSILTAPKVVMKVNPHNHPASHS